MWTSVSPGTEGQYNNLLSCTNCFNPVFRPTSTEPATIVYKVCGSANTFTCGDGFDCNYVTVNIKEKLSVELDITPLNVCERMSRNHCFGYPYRWQLLFEWFKAYDAGGTRVDRTTYTPTDAGPHSVKITDIEGGTTCDILIHNFDISFDEDPPVLTFSGTPDLFIECRDPGSANQLISEWLNNVTATDDGGLYLSAGDK